MPTVSQSAKQLVVGQTTINTATKAYYTCFGLRPVVLLSVSHLLAFDSE